MRHKKNKVWYDHLQIDFNVLNVLLNTDLNAVLKIIQILFSLVLDQPAVMKKKKKKSAFNSSFPNKKLGKTITIRQSAHPPLPIEVNIRSQIRRSVKSLLPK